MTPPILKKEQLVESIHRDKMGFIVGCALTAATMGVAGLILAAGFGIKKKIDENHLDLLNQRC